MFLARLGAVDALRPTIFELVDEETLIALVKPALRTVVAVLAPRYPQQLLYVYNRFEELYALLTLAIEKYYLDACDGSFGENFYGLKRTVTVTALASRPLQPGDRYAALATIVLVPYLRARLDDLHERHAAPLQGLARLHADDADERPDTPWAERLRAALTVQFVRWYPYVKAGYRAIVLGYQFAYLYGLTRYYSPWLHLLRQEIRRLSLSDMRLFSEKAQKYLNEISARYPGHAPVNVLRRQVLLSMHMLLSSLQTLLPMSIFFFKFLQWWYASGYAKTSLTPSLPIPPAPAPLTPTAGGVGLPEDRTLCPLCRKPRTNATVIPSGYVFCFPCIYSHVEQHGVCPVTLERTSLDQLRKIYGEIS